MEKKYYALVEGNTPSKGTLINYLYKNEELVKSFVTDDINKGKRAELQYETQKQGKNQSLVDFYKPTNIDYDSIEENAQ